MDRQPTEEGKKYNGPPTDAKGVIVKKHLPIGKARSLVELSAEYAFFTPAPMYLHGGFYDGPLFDYMYELGHDVPIYYHRFNHPVFRGLDSVFNDPGWNFGLLATPLEHWKGLAEFFISTVIADTDRKRYVAYGEQSLTILDPLALDFARMWRPDLPTVEITAFGVEASDFRALFVENESRLTDPPILRFYPPNPEIRAAAASYFSGGNPVIARETYRTSQEKEKECEIQPPPSKILSSFSPPESGTASLPT